MFTRQIKNKIENNFLAMENEIWQTKLQNPKK